MCQEFQDELMHKGCICTRMQLPQDARLPADVCLYRRSLQHTGSFSWVDRIVTVACDLVPNQLTSCLVESHLQALSASLMLPRMPR